MSKRVIHKTSANKAVIMLDFVAEDVETAIQPQAWRIEFAEGSEALPDGVETLEIAEPRNVTALLTPLALSVALQQTAPQTDGAVTVVWMPPSVDRASTVERDADEWMRGAGEKRKDAMVRADVRTVRVVWDESRAVIYASQRDIRSALDAIARFSIVQKEALALEAAVKSEWASIEANVDLTHGVTRRDQRRQRHVNEITESAARRKIAWLRVRRSVEQLDPTLAEPSKRLFAELVSGASLYDRMEMLDDPIQYALDQYELANARLTEASHARNEIVLSIIGYVAIILLLVAQLLLMMGPDSVLLHWAASWK
jgi:hypothetical protein